MAANTMKRYGTAGYIVRSSPGGAPSSVSGHWGTPVRMPDGKLVRVIDRTAFERAVDAAKPKGKK